MKRDRGDKERTWNVRSGEYSIGDMTRCTADLMVDPATNWVMCLHRSNEVSRDHLGTCVRAHMAIYRSCVRHPAHKL